jgi:small subunit ribosomal protein S21
MIIISCKGSRIEGALKKYRQKVDKVGQLTELRSRKEFEKPSVKKRKVNQRAKYRNSYGNSKI